jgi:hypothetical protein
MTKAFLEITMKISPEKRPQAGGVYTKYRQPFLSSIPGAKSKDLLLRAEDVQVLHGFDSKANAESYPRWPPQIPPPVAGSNSPTPGSGTGGLYSGESRLAI